MKKRIAALLLALTLLTGVPALAVSDSADNFVRSRTYTGQFSDMAVSSTFYANAAALYEYGLSVGKTDGTFGPGDSVTVGQLLIFAGRIRSLWRTGDAEAGAAAYSTAGSAVCAPYLAYLQAEGVVGTELGSRCDGAATRAQVAHVLANTLPKSELAEINADAVSKALASGRLITDVTDTTPWAADILLLYKAGISQGGQNGNFQPDRAITRGALAAMLTRLVDPALRVTPAWDLTRAFHAAGTTWGSLITGDTAYTAAPATAAAVAADVNHMLASGSDTLTLNYGSWPSSAVIRQVMDEALTAAQLECEQGYNGVSCAYDSSGSVTLTFYTAGRTRSETAALREYTLSAAIAVHDALWDSGAITWTMSDYDKAKVYYDWICRSCTYDYSAADQSLSHTAYGLFHDGTAVCDGYTGAYNLLLKLDGITCTSISNDDHMWTLATLDGTACHIDTTWGDSGDQGTNYTFFAMTPSQSWSYHPW